MIPRFYFDSSRLKMGGPARFLVRLVSYAAYGMLAAAVPVLVFAELRWMQSLGVFLILFIIDRLLHLNQAEKLFMYLPKKGRINLNDYISPAVFSILEKASEKARFIGGDLRLWLIRHCLERPEIRKNLARSGISWKELDRGVAVRLKENRQRYSKKEVLSLMEEIIISAAAIARKNKKEFINPEEVLGVLGNDIFVPGKRCD